MVKKLVLKDQIYNFSSEKECKEVQYRYQKFLGEKVKGFPSTKIIIKKLRKYDKRFEIEISGPEEVFVFNYLIPLFIKRKVLFVLFCDHFIKWVSSLLNQVRSYEFYIYKVNHL